MKSEMLLRQILSLALACSANAIAFDYPQPTGFVRLDPLGDDVFPPAPTAAPAVAHELIRRALASTILVGPDNTCGFFNGRQGAPLSCPGTDSCVFVSATAGATTGNVACCPPAPLSCGIRYACVDYAAFNASKCDDGCREDVFTLKCTQATAPYCNSVTFVQNLVSDFYCNNDNISTWQTLFTTYSGEADGRVYSTSIVNPSTTGPAITKTAASISGFSTITVTPTPTPTPVPAGTPTGAIVGGSIGGVVVIAVIGGLFWWFRRRSKNQRLANSPPTQNYPSPYASPNPLPGMDPNTAYGAASGKPQPMMDYSQHGGYGGYPNSPPMGHLPPPNPANQGFYQNQRLSAGGYDPASATSTNTQYHSAFGSSPQSPNNMMGGNQGYTRVPQELNAAPSSYGPFEGPTYEAGGNEIRR